MVGGIGFTWALGGAVDTFAIAVGVVASIGFVVIGGVSGGSFASG